MNKKKIYIVDSIMLILLITSTLTIFSLVDKNTNEKLIKLSISTMLLLTSFVLYQKKHTNKSSHILKTISMFLGLCSALSMPPFNITPIIIISLATLMIMLLTLEDHDVFICSFLFGASYQMINMYWVYKPLSIAGNKFNILTPICIILIGIFSGFFTSISTLLAKKSTHQKPLVFAISWSIMEFWRNFIFSGFPWGTIGYTWSNSIKMIQIASIIGIYGISFITAFTAFNITSSRKIFQNSIVSIAIIFFVFFYGHVVIKKNETQYNNNINLFVIGSQIKQQYKWKNSELKKNFDTQILATQNALNESNYFTGKNIIIWPETSIAGVFYNSNEFLQITKLIPDKIDFFITGALRGDSEKIWNSVFVFERQNDSIYFYDKITPVIFGEYIPKFIPMHKITPGHINISNGMNSNVISSKKIPSFGITICYESLMPFKLHNTKKTPKWIINVTNDGWFEGTIAPKKHLLISRLRAIEMGMPLIRSSNQGISSIIDPYGRILKQDEKYIFSKLPKNRKTEAIFSKTASNDFILKISTIITNLLIVNYYTKIRKQLQ